VIQSARARRIIVLLGCNGRQSASPNRGRGSKICDNGRKEGNERCSSRCAAGSAHSAGATSSGRDASAVSRRSAKDSNSRLEQRRKTRFCSCCHSFSLFLPLLLGRLRLVLLPYTRALGSRFGLFLICDALPLLPQLTRLLAHLLARLVALLDLGLLVLARTSLRAKHQPDFSLPRGKTEAEQPAQNAVGLCSPLLRPLGHAKAVEPLVRKERRVDCNALPRQLSCLARAAPLQRPRTSRSL
jgi:hypothetical protein